MKNEKIIREAKEKLDFLSGILGRMLDGELKQYSGAEEFGLSAQAFGSQIRRHFEPFIKSSVLSEKDLAGVIKEMGSAVEKLVCDIFGINVSDKILMVGYAEQEKILGLIKETLSEKEYSVLSARYGLEHNCPGEKGESLEQVGKRYGVQRERIRQIQVNCLRKLRSPAIWKQMVPSHKEYVAALMDLEEMKKKDSKLNSEYNAVLSCMRWFQYQKAVRDIFNGMLDQGRKLVSAETMVSDMPGLAKEIVESFASYGILSIHDLMSMEESAVKEISSSLGIPSEDIEEICNKACVFPDCFFHDPEVSIDDMGLSVRSYNALRRAGILTVRDIALQGAKLKKVRNLGKHCYVEICSVMEEKYGIDMSAPSSCSK